ncbi:MAG: hypothetical protein ACI9QV_000444 [Methylophagaceae bacterium]|jgi:hypothetical protein
MTQFTDYAKNNFAVAGEQKLSHKKTPISDIVFDDSDWKSKILLGNKNKDARQLTISMQHYTRALHLAKKNFMDYRFQDEVPCCIVPAIVISYLNLAQVWFDRDQKFIQRKYLISAFDFLVQQLGKLDVTNPLHEQIYQGIGKIHVELMLCLKELGDLKTLELKEAILRNLGNISSK